ncbi:MAG TPA: acylphosphatase [Methanosarcinales archaeon]|nr:acylphosphatase [Methanosarcinales archaeon]
MKRVTIIAKGEVQRVGYRDIVEKIARKLHLTGYVENLKPYDVKIVAEGDENSLNEFLTRIRIDKHPVSPISVEDIDIEFGAATREFEYFEIRRGDWTEELGERMDVAGALLYRSVELGIESVGIGRVMLGKQDQMLGKQDQMIDKQDQMLGKQDQMIDKQDQMLGKQDQMIDKQDQMLGKQDIHTHVLTEFRDQTQQNFDVLDVKYGKISDGVERAIDEMHDERKELRASVNNLTDAIVELARSRK